MGGSGYCDLDKIKKCRYVLNFKSKDNNCFRYAILAPHVKRPDFLKSYTLEIIKMYDWPDSPMLLDNLSDFENKNNISVNIYTFDSEKEIIHPMRIAKQELDRHRDLLFVSNHFMLIKDFSKMMCYFTKKRAYDFCKKCFLGFKRNAELKSHSNSCSGIQIISHTGVTTIPVAIRKRGDAITLTNCNSDFSFQTAILNGLDEQNFNWDGMISKSIFIGDVKRFERKNSQISVNIFTCDQNGKIFPVKASDTVKKIHKDLLLIRSKEGNFYYEINNLRKLVQSKISKQNRGDKMFFCKRCLSHFWSESVLNKHIELCRNNAIGRNILPTSANKWVEFKNYKAKELLPVCLFLDLECSLTPIQKKISDITTYIQEHQVTSWCLYPVSIYEERKPILYRGKMRSKIFWIESERKSSILNLFMTFLSRII